MKGENRRNAIIKRLSVSSDPVCANMLSSEFNVSRQTIVKDIAKLRNLGYGISSVSRGYILDKESIARKVFKTYHSDEDVEKELSLIVECGGIIENVFIYHKHYNKIFAPLNIKNNDDIVLFMQNIKSGNSSLLKNVTGGYHYHTVCAQNNETINLIESALKKEGFLAKLQEYEPSEITN